MTKPLILVVSDRQAVLSALPADLCRRFGADYDIVAFGSTTAGMKAVMASLTAGVEVAVVIADQKMGGSPAVELLVRLHEVVPTAKRVMLIERGDWSATHPVVSAVALGQVDHHLFSPWRPLERILYPAVSEILAEWDKTQDATDVPVRIVGSGSSPRSHELRDALTRVSVPYWFYEDTSTEGQQLLTEARLDGTRLPVVAFYDGQILVEPTLEKVWQALGVGTRLGIETCDLVVVGGGPAGLAAAVYASSEGLDTLLLESAVPGGQAGTSSLIRNYLGFHRGISGDDLATRAVEQAWLFGSRLTLSQTAIKLRADGNALSVTTDGGGQITARAVVIATGVSWRRIGVPALEALVGVGVFYGAAAAEARAMQGRAVFVVGAGNSAGQAVMHLSKYADKVTMLVRGETLRTTMSEYLVTEIEESPNVEVLFQTEVVGGSGAGRLETLTLRHRGNNDSYIVPASALFLLIGAEPRTEWLRGSIARDERGYILTGRDLVSVDDQSVRWPLPRPPMLLETSLPGVFAAGDVRHRSIKRVAAAVGEGSTAVQLVHEHLRYAAGDATD